MEAKPATTTNFFFKLPAELRVMIYELSFTPYEPAVFDPYHDISSAAPKKDLLYASRQTYIEGKAQWEEATKAYWSTQTINFYVARGNDTQDIYSAMGYAKSIPTHGLALAKTLAVKHSNYGCKNKMVKLDAPGVWRHEFGQGNIEQVVLPGGGRVFRRPKPMFVAIDCSPKWWGFKSGKGKVESHYVDTLEEAKEIVNAGKPVPLLQQIEVLLHWVN